MYFSQQVARIHGPAQLEYRQSRNKKRGIYAIDSRAGRGGRARGRFGGRGRRDGRGQTGRGRGAQATHIINGIDVSDPNRNFTADEWEALGPNNGRTTVLQLRERNNTRGNRDERGRARGRGRGNNTRNVSATGVDEANHDVKHGENDGTRSSDRGGRNGRGFGRGAYGGRSS